MTINQIPELLDELQNKEAYIRNAAIKKIIKGKIGDERIITALKEIIENDPSMAVRNFARSALDVFGDEIAHQDKMDSALVVFGDEKAHQDKMNKEKLQRLIDQLKYGNNRQRRSASYKLGKSNDEDSVPYLISAYNDKDSSVRQNVITGLKNIASKDALDFLASKDIPINVAPNRNQNPQKIILVSLLSAPFFDFFSAIVGLVPFVNGGCGGMLLSPILALIFAWLTGLLAQSLFNTQKYSVLIGLLCGFIAGALAALIYYPDAC